MNCLSCGGPLPQDARACPNCGTLTPAYYGNSGDGQSLTAISGNVRGQQSTGNPYDTPYESQIQTPNTGYGTNPYGQTSNPYTGTPTPPPPPEKKQRLPIFIAVALVVLVLGVGAIIVVPRLLPGSTSSNTNGKYNSTPGTTATSAPTHTPTGPLSPEQAQSLYDQTIQKTPQLSDPLSGADNFGWDNQPQTHTSCAFTGGAYHAKAPVNYFAPCYAKATNFSNFVFQAEMSLSEGHSGGLVFRADATNDKSYQFRISNDGTYILNKYTLDSNGELQVQPLTSGQSALIKKGATDSNLLSVIAQGNNLYLFVNNKYVGKAQDDLYHSGVIGVFGDSDAGSVEAVFRNAKIWSLD